MMRCQPHESQSIFWLNLRRMNRFDSFPPDTIGWPKSSFFTAQRDFHDGALKPRLNEDKSSPRRQRISRLSLHGITVPMAFGPYTNVVYCMLSDAISICSLKENGGLL